MRSVGPRGAVFVRPTSLAVVPVLNRYQYHLFGSRPLTSTCTECPYSGCAMIRPLRTTRFIFSSKAICQSKETDSLCQSCVRFPSGISRVQRTTPWAVGSPEATPAENGSEVKRGEDSNALSFRIG